MSMQMPDIVPHLVRGTFPPLAAKAAFLHLEWTVVEALIYCIGPFYVCSEATQRKYGRCITLGRGVILDAWMNTNSQKNHLGAIIIHILYLKTRLTFGTETFCLYACLSGVLNVVLKSRELHSRSVGHTDDARRHSWKSMMRIFNIFPGRSRLFELYSQKPTVSTSGSS